MKVITESTNPDRDAQIIASVQGAATKKDVAKAHCLSASRVQQILRQHKACEAFELYIVDGSQRVEVTNVVASWGFHHASRLAIREYHTFFSRLELPNWKLVCGDRSIPLNSPELAK